MTGIAGEGALHMTLARDRDAYASIRGYVYQVDLTIQRWLDLADDETLELELGEDIDVVRAASGEARDLDWQRLLEQVKHLERNVTLRTPALRGALANFHEHYRLNPNLKLQFRFTATAQAGRENPSTLPPGDLGVEVWRQVATSQAAAPDEALRLDALREFLVGAARPEDIPEESWRTWQQFLTEGALDAFRAFVRRVEIVPGSPDSASLQRQLEARFLRDGLATDPNHARQLYNALFAGLFSRLSSPGLKRITKADLALEVAGNGVGSHDRVLLAGIERFRYALDNRFREIERQVAEFRGDLGAVRTRVDVLTEVVASRNAPRGTLAGDTRTYQFSDNYFGPELDPSATFNHGRPLVDRNDIVERFYAAVTESISPGRSGVVVIGGIGGVGKSRLLIALSNRLQNEGIGAVRWIRDGVTPDVDSFNEMPDGPCILFCDDAHRRPDLGLILSIPQWRRDPTAIVLGMRPRGREAVRVAAFHAGVGDRLHDLGDLQELEKGDLVALVAAELGPDAKLAEQLVRVTGGSTLVSLIAARLLRIKRLDPRLLAHEDEAVHLIFDGFQDEIYGKVVASVDESIARRLLELLAAIGPVSLTQDGIFERMAAVLDTDAASTSRATAALQEAGVLREQRRGIRIVPDILSDHILKRVLIAGDRLTGAEGRILEIMGPSLLPNLLRNIGELDWQLQSTAGPAALDIFSEVWDKFTRAFKDAPNSIRATYLERLAPVAAFQPARVLSLCEWIAKHPEGTEDASTWGFKTTAGDVLAKAAKAVAIVAQHDEHLEAAIDLLWRLGRDDARTPNQHPDHPIRSMNELVAYARHRDVRRQGRSIEALRRWTTQPGWSRHPHSPLGVAEAVLTRSIVEDSYDPARRTVTMTRLGINAANTWPAREAAIRLLSELSLGEESRGRVVAAEILVKALHPPASQFGHIVSPEEEESFRDQDKAAINALGKIAADSKDAIVRVNVRDGLQLVRWRTQLAWKKDSLRQLIDRLKDTTATRRVRVWGRMFRDAFASADDARVELTQIRQLAADLTIRVATELTNELAAGPAMIAYLVSEDRRFSQAGIRSEPHYLLSEVTRLRPDIGVDVADWVVSGHTSARAVGFWRFLTGLLERLRVPRRAGSWIIGKHCNTDAAAFYGSLPYLLARLKVVSRENYARLLNAAAASAPAGLRAAAASSLYQVAHVGWDERESSHVRALLRDSDANVRRISVAALHNLSGAAKTEFLSFIVIGGAKEVAEELADLWAYQPAGQRPAVSAGSVQRILGELAELKSLHSHGGIDEMLSLFTTRYPLLVLDFVLERARRQTHASEGSVWGDRYEAIPFDGFQGVWNALQATPEYPQIIRRLLSALVEERRTVDAHWRRATIEVVQRIIHWDDEIEKAIREWMASGRCEDVSYLDSLLGAQQSLFVIEHRVFVEELLEWAHLCDPSSRKRIESALHVSTTVHARMRDVGQPNALDVRLRDDSLRIANELADVTGSSAVAAFYREVASSSQRTLDGESNRDLIHRASVDGIEWDDDD